MSLRLRVGPFGVSSKGSAWVRVGPVSAGGRVVPRRRRGKETNEGLWVIFGGLLVIGLLVRVTELLVRHWMFVLIVLGAVAAIVAALILVASLLPAPSPAAVAAGPVTNHAWHVVADGACYISGCPCGSFSDAGGTAGDTGRHFDRWCTCGHTFGAHRNA